MEETALISGKLLLCVWWLASSGLRRADALSRQARWSSHIPQISRLCMCSHTGADRKSVFGQSADLRWWKRARLQGRRAAASRPPQSITTNREANKDCLMRGTWSSTNIHRHRPHMIHGPKIQNTLDLREIFSPMFANFHRKKKHLCIIFLLKFTFLGLNWGQEQGSHEVVWLRGQNHHQISMFLPHGAQLLFH